MWSRIKCKQQREHRQRQQQQQQQQREQREATKVNITFKAEDKLSCQRARGRGDARRGALPNGKSAK